MIMHYYIFYFIWLIDNNYFRIIMEDTTIDTYDISKVNPDNQFDETIVRIYRNYSVNVSDLPKILFLLLNQKKIYLVMKKK